MRSLLPIHEAVLASRLMTIMAGRVTESLLTFTGWLIGGFTALLGFLLGNLDKLSEFVPPSALGVSVKIFVLAVVLHVVQRYLAFIVSGAVAASKEVENVKFPEGINMSLVMGEIEASTFWPARVLMRKNFEKVRNGDYAASGRMMGKLAQTQGVLAIVQLLIVISAAYQVIAAL